MLRSLVRAMGILLTTTVIAASSLQPATAVDEDTTPPVIVSSSVSPETVNLAEGAAKITLTLHIVDESGVHTPTVQFDHSESIQSVGFGPMSLVSGTASDGVWEKSIDLPASAGAGAWSFLLFPLIDFPGNMGHFSNVGTVQVTNEAAPKEKSPPKIVEVSATPTSANLYDGPAIFTFRLRITDETGVHAPTVLLSHPSGQQYGFGGMSLVSGDHLDGIWERKIVVDKGSFTGTWTLLLFPLVDYPGNSTFFQNVANVTVTDTAPLAAATPTITGTPTVGSVLTAVPGIWGPEDVEFAYQWSADGTEIKDATQNTVELAPDQAGKAITVEVTGSKAGYTTEAKSSAATGEVATGVLTAKVPTVTGTPMVGSTLTAVPGAWSPAGVGFAYQWSADGEPIKNATQNTVELAPDQAGKSITVAVTGSKAGYATEAKSSAATSKVATGVLTAKAPTITGTPTVGNTLTAVPGTWSPAGVGFAYQWSADGTKIDGATITTLDLAPEFAEKSITVDVTGSKAGYITTSKTSAPMAKVATAALIATVPTITGTTTVGSTLTAVPGVWSPAGVELAYQWSADGTEIKDATQNTVELAPDQAGKAITVAVTGTKAGYTTETKSSAATSKVATAALGSVIPTITGTTTVGSTLTAVPGAWSPAGVGFAYQWYTDGSRIEGTTKATLDLTPELAGKAITVAVTGTKAGYITATTASVPTEKVTTAALTSVIPTITGISTVGSTLTAVPGIWGPDGVELSYQWSADGTRIEGATKAILDLAPELAGKAITVAVTGTKAGYTTTSKSSAATERVATASLASVIPTITGTPTVGNTLSAVPGAWSPAGVEFAYQWSADGAKIDGAMTVTLDVGPELAGKTVTVTVTGSKPGYTTTSKSSAATEKVATATIAVVPSAPTSVAATGRYTIPSALGVEYRVNGTVKAAGTYASGYTKVTITAVAKPGYTVSGTVSWILDLSKKTVTAPAPSVNYTTKTITLPRVTGVSYSIDGVLKSAASHKATTQTTVSAKASAANYVVTAKAWKYDLRTAVTPAKPVFSASGNTVKIPAKTGVTYYVNGVFKKAGTHTYAGTGTVTTKASSGSYKLAGSTSWTFDNRNAVTPTKPVFSASGNTVKIPARTGVAYYINGVLKKAGTYKYTGTGTVTTKASSGSYKLAGTTSWKFDNRNAVTPTKPVFSAFANTVKIPAKTGVTYYVNNVLKKAGTHKYTGNVTVTTKASSGSYKLTATQKWTARL
jgi:hypothetical protein